MSVLRKSFEIIQSEFRRRHLEQGFVLSRYASHRNYKANQDLPFDNRQVIELNRRQDLTFCCLHRVHAAFCSVRGFLGRLNNHQPTYQIEKSTDLEFSIPKRQNLHAIVEIRRRARLLSGRRSRSRCSIGVH